jgi:hypothetical protein
MNPQPLPHEPDPAPSAGPDTLALVQPVTPPNGAPLPALHHQGNGKVAHFQRNRSRMLYQTFRQAGYFIGSRVVEAGCKTSSGSGSSNRGCSGAAKEPPIC